MLLLSHFVKRIFGSRNERVLRRLLKQIQKINALESHYETLSDETLKAKTTEFKNRFAQGESLDTLLVEAFASVREASKRTLKQRHFDVQLIGGMILHHGKIAEMCTGEGKTLVATLAAYLNALTGKGVHIITVNDYLAKRDATWMGPIYEFLGLSVGVNLADMSHTDKQTAYAADITYGTNNEFGFDYLRDNMVFSPEEKVQRDLQYAIVDEVDSILIDEARTPLIISGPTEDTSDLYVKINALIPKLNKCAKEGEPGDYFLDEKHRQVHLTEEGHQHIEELMYQNGLLQADESLYDPINIHFMHHFNAALRANKLFHRDVDYIVNEGEIVIVDEHTGRTMPGRRWSDGLHQAVEAKEGVSIRSENQTLATITFQNYFRMYNKLSGMTGTADTEAYELQQIYALEVIVIPTNKPLIRNNYADKIYLTATEKFKAIVEEIKVCIETQQPVLVGTASIENSELLSNMLQKESIPHQMLNAKHHEREAKTIEQAGQPGAITIATNMAGRGTDIVLGGNLEAEIAALENPTPPQIEQVKADWQKRHNDVIATGGLHVLGSERHESRRIDNQLRGRSGRQGDPGSSRFYVALDDNLMRIFASDRMASIMKRLGMQEGESIEHPWITKAIENAQRKVESYHFDVRKQLLEFDNVANDQRKVVYQQRAELMAAQEVSETINLIQKDVINRVIDSFVPPHSLEEQWDVEGLEKRLALEFNLSLSLNDLLKKDTEMDEEKLRAFVEKQLIEAYRAKTEKMDIAVIHQLEKTVMLQILDTHWKEHLAMMDYLRQSVHLSSYAQKNPKQEYKREAFILFTNMLESFKLDVIKILSTVQIRMPDDVTALEEQRREQLESQQMSFQHDDPRATKERTPEKDSEGSPSSTQPLRRTMPKIGRNEPCPCGSGKKHKQCCGRFS